MATHSIDNMDPQLNIDKKLKNKRGKAFFKSLKEKNLFFLAIIDCIDNSNLNIDMVLNLNQTFDNIWTFV